MKLTTCFVVQTHAIYNAWLAPFAGTDSHCSLKYTKLKVGSVLPVGGRGSNSSSIRPSTAPALSSSSSSSSSSLGGHLRNYNNNNQLMMSMDEMVKMVTKPVGGRGRVCEVGRSGWQ